MRIKSVCAVIMMFAFLGAGHSYADQKIKTKSNIKNDRAAQPVASSECAGVCAAGEQCVKAPVTDAASTDTAKSYCTVVSEEKSSVAIKERE